MLNGSGDLATPLLTNYPEIPDSFLTQQLSLSEYIAQMLVDGTHILAK